MQIGNKLFDVKHHCYVMGILNVTPDSFSDGGKWNEIDLALHHAEQMLKEGADIIDIGGESTRPGYTPVSVEEEIARTAPVIEAIRSRFDCPISIDTYKSPVAKEAIRAGADLVNDIWGLKADDKMARLIADTGKTCCLMHNRTNEDYVSFLDDVMADLKESMELARAAGIGMDKIILDPGVGFAKSYEQNLKVIQHLGDFSAFQVPVLLGTSRKSVIGLTLDLPKDERLEGTLATTAVAVEQGTAFVRVHDVKENVRLIKMLEAIRDC